MKFSYWTFSWNESDALQNVRSLAGDVRTPHKFLAKLLTVLCVAIVRTPERTYKLHQQQQQQRKRQSSAIVYTRKALWKGKFYDTFIGLLFQFFVLLRFVLSGFQGKMFFPIRRLFMSIFIIEISDERRIQIQCPLQVNMRSVVEMISRNRNGGWLSIFKLFKRMSPTRENTADRQTDRWRGEEKWRNLSKCCRQWHANGSKVK